MKKMFSASESGVGLCTAAGNFIWDANVVNRDIQLHTAPESGSREETKHAGHCHKKLMCDFSLYFRSLCVCALSE